MITVKVTGKIKERELNLASIHGNLKAGANLTLPDETFYKSDIQAAIKKGYLEIKDDDLLETDDTRIEIINVSGHPLAIDNISFAPGEVRIVTDIQFHSANIQSSIARGWVESKKFTTERKESTKKVDKTVSEPKKKTTTKTSKKDVSKIEKGKKGKKTKKDEPDAESWNAQTWDPLAEKMISKKDSNARVGKVEGWVPNNESEDGIQTGDIDFTEDAIGAKGKRILRTKKVSSSKSKTGKTKTAKARKSKSLKPVGRRRQAPSSDGGPDFVDFPNESGGVGFVDVEQEIEKISNHPKLKRQNLEIE